MDDVVCGALMCVICVVDIGKCMSCLQGFRVELTMQASAEFDTLLYIHNVVQCVSSCHCHLFMHGSAGTLVCVEKVVCSTCHDGWWGIFISTVQEPGLPTPLVISVADHMEDSRTPAYLSLC